MSRSKPSPRATATQPTFAFENEDPTQGLDNQKLRELRAGIAELLVEAMGTPAEEEEKDDE